MGNFTYLRNADNEVVKLASTVTATATDTADASTLGASNVLILPTSLPWRSNGTGAKSLIVDFGTAVTVDFVAVVGHNVSASAALFNFVGGATSPPTTDTINLLTNHLGPGTTFGIRSAGSVSHRYWAVNITDNSNPDSYYEVGYVVLGVKTELGFNMNFDWIEQVHINNRMAETEAGSPLVGEQVDERSQVDLTFGNLLLAERDTLKQFIYGFNGARNPAFIVPDPDDNFGFFGRLLSPNTIPMTHKNKGIVDEVALSFMEDGNGIRINV